MSEQEEVTALFAEMLASASKDGGAKLSAGKKVHWTIDQTHEAALFSHLSKWKHGEQVDADSGAHPLVHLAWRALAIAWQEKHYDEQVAKLLGRLEGEVLSLGGEVLSD
jgi:hypothetical protein